MEIERETVLQVLLAATAVALFIAALVGVGLAFGTDSPVEDQAVEGDIEGSFDTLETSDGRATGEFEGSLSNGLDATVSGEIEGTVTDGTLAGTIDGTVRGSVDGTITADIEGTLDQEAESFNGTFEGTVDGTSDTAISPSGGIALVALIAGFVIMMPIFGYAIERYDSDS